VSLGEPPAGRQVPAGATTGHAEAVLGLDNVRLELPVASVGTRSLAAAIDYLLVALGFLLWSLVWFGASRWLGLGFGWTLAGVIVGGFLLDYGYFAGAELASRGRTFGKWALDLLVVSRQGGRPGTSALLVRNVVRLADLLVGVPLMASDPLARRLGDRLAGTLVVQGGSRAGVLAARRVPRGWGAREVGLLEGLLQREAELDPGRRDRIARGILGLIERDDPAFLAGLPSEDDAVATLRRAAGLEPR
jgi:uncharacterized RDD family membrane protein YckC